MQIIKVRADSSYIIWAPLVLIGPDLNPQVNIMLDISGGQIAAIRTIEKDQLPGLVSSDHRLICLDQNTTLLPSLIDAHIHLALDGVDYRRSCRDWDNRKALQSRLESEGKEYIKAGIGFVRDGGDRREINLNVKNNLSSENFIGPRVIATGSALRRDKTYGSFLGQGYRSPQEIQVSIKRLWSAGADQIKVIVSGVVSFTDYGLVDGPIMLPEEIRKIVEYAREYDLKVMAHASSAIAVDLAVHAGVDSIEHGYFIDRENLHMMAERQIAWVPTIIPVAAQVRDPMLDKRSIQEIEVITRTYEEQVKNLELAHKLGVPLGVGTDSGAAGVRHGSSLVEEMLLYTKGALSNQAILKGATSVNAGILGMAKEAGSIEIGRTANLIAVSGNPLNNLAVLRKIKMHLITG